MIMRNSVRSNIGVNDGILNRIVKMLYELIFHDYCARGNPLTTPKNTNIAYVSEWVLRSRNNCSTIDLYHNLDNV